MPTSSELKRLVSKDILFFYILDTSHYMQGMPIHILNKIMKDRIQQLKGENAKSPNGNIRLGIMEYNSHTRWLTTGRNNEPATLEADDIFWSDLKPAGFSNLGNALLELNLKMSEKSLCRTIAGIRPPFVVIISNGTIDDNIQGALSLLQRNPFFSPDRFIYYPIQNTPVLAPEFNNSIAHSSDEMSQRVSSYVRFYSFS